MEVYEKYTHIWMCTHNVGYIFSCSEVILYLNESVTIQTCTQQPDHSGIMKNTGPNTVWLITELCLGKEVNYTVF